MVRKKATRPGWRAVFDDFTTKYEIDSKDAGRVVMKPYGTQLYLLDQIAEGMDSGERFFCCLKARQLGCTTILIPIDVLWLMVHEGTKGAIIANSPEVAANCRTMVRDLCERLPETHKVAITDDNRDMTRWANKSSLHYLVAGTSEKKTGLGKSHGFSLVHGTEVGEWGSEQGLNSLIASLAQDNPNRLYIFESTAQGRNLFYRLWMRSLEHPERRCVFIPWWKHERYALRKNTKAFKFYSADKGLADHEALMIAEVRKLGHVITPEQLAWYRKTCDDMTSLDMVKQNYPSTPDEAFLMSAPAFFAIKPLKENLDRAKADTFKGFRVRMADDVTEMRIEALDSVRAGVDLRVWEPPAPTGVYCISVIAGIASGEQLGGESVVQVVRAFSDKVEQVAEYAACVEPYQLAWVAAHLAGYYRNSYVNIEVDGIGRAVFREMKHLRELIELGVLSAHPQNDPDGIFQNMIWYLYQRVDAAAGSARTFHWLGKNDAEKVKELYVDLKDSWTTNRTMLHSVPLLNEMGNVISDGDYFGGDGDEPVERVYALALALRTWIDSCRLYLIAQGATRERELARDTETKSTSLLQAIIERHFHRASAALQQNQIPKR